MKGCLKWNGAIPENDRLLSRTILCLAFLNYTYDLSSNSRMYGSRMLLQIGEIGDMASRTRG